MAFLNGNKPIVTNGLVYALDFGNQRSYISGSSTVKSLIFPATGSIFGDLQSSSLQSGLFNFNTNPGPYGNTAGTKITPANTTVFTPLIYGSEFTLSVVLKISAGTLNQTIFSGDPTGTQNYRTALTYENGVYIYGFNYTPNTNDYGRSYSAPGNTLEHRTIRYKNGTWDHFVNGIPVLPINVGTYGNPSNADLFTISGRGPSLFQNMISGSMGSFYLYNRSLSANEIYQNYLISAQRYGLSTRPKPYTLDENAYLFLSQSGITDPIITGSINTFVLGLKSASLWDKMVAIYPFVGTGSLGINLTGSHRWNLKEPTLVTYPLSFTGSWQGSTSGSAPSGSNTNISIVGYSPSTTYPNISNSNVHVSVLSYDTPVSTSYIMGTGMTTELATSTLAGDYGTPAAAYSVRKVKTSYSGALMDVRRSYDNTTSSIGYYASGDLDTGSLLDWTLPGRNTLPGAYSGLAAAYSLRLVSSSYSGSAIRVRGTIENQFRDIGFNSNGNLDTGSLLNFTATGSNTLPSNYSGLAAAYSLRKVSSSYSGFAIEVQSGSVSQSIGFDSFGNLDTGSLLAFVGSGSGFIKTWYDQSGNNNHATQSVAANQPQIVSSGNLITSNGKPALRFDGVSMNLSMAGLANRAVLDQYFVTNTSDTQYLYPTDSATNFGFVAQSGSSNTALYQNNGTPSLYANSTLFTGSTRDNVYNFLSGSKLVVQQNANTTLWSTYIFGTYSSWEYNGTLQELLAFTSSVSASRTYIENNINAYYNIYITSSTSTENAYVTTWYDQSGNGRHAIQTATGSQPLIVSSGSLIIERGRPAISFDGTSNYLASTTVNDSYNSSSIFGVFRIISQSGEDLPFSYGQPGSVRSIYSATSKKLSFATWGNDFVSTFDSIDTSSYLYSVTQNSSNIVLRKNNQEATGTLVSIPSVASTGPYSIGTLAGNTNTYYTQMNSSEFIIYNNDQTANRTLIENNINNYYSIYTSSAAGYVAQWYDQSGNNRHATQTATGSQPIIVLSGSIIFEGTKPAVNYVDNTKFFDIPATVPQALPFTTFGVQSSGSGFPAVFGLGGNNFSQTIAYFSAFNAYYFTGGGKTANITAVAPPNYHLLTGVTTTTLFSPFVNGNALTTAVPTDTTTGTTYIYLNKYNNGNGTGKQQEFIAYPTTQISIRDAIEYGINNYYNIYPQTSSFATSSFAIRVASGSVSASLNNALQSGIASSGPLGLITVSRTGSNALTIARNGTPNSYSVPASGALATNIYLGAINNNGLTLGNSPLNLSFASIGTGLTNTEVNTLNTLVRNLQYNLGRFPSTYTISVYPNAIAAFSLRKLSTTYTGSAIDVRRSLDNTTSSIGFDTYGNLDTISLISFISGSSGYVAKWYDQSGNNNHLTQVATGSQPLIVNSGSVVTAQTFQTRQFEGPNGANNNTLPAIYFNGKTLGLNRTLYSTNQISYYTVFNLGLSSNLSSDGYSVMATNTETGTSAWGWPTSGGGPSGYINMFQPEGSARRDSFPASMPKGGTILYSGYHTGSAYTVFVNNVSKGTNTAQQYNSGSFLTVGSGNGYGLAGSIQEIIFYATGSTTNNTNIQDSINAYYRIY